MNKLLLVKFCGPLILSAILSAMAWGSCDPSEHAKNEVKVEKKEFYGKVFEASEVQDIAVAMNNYEEVAGKEIQMQADVKNVCRNKGCWMMLGSNSDEDIRVRFEDYGFFVPVSLVGQSVIVSGTLDRTKVSKELLQHFKEDAGASEEEIATVVEDAYEYTFTARGVQLMSTTN